eukprot:9621347-Karenia_brevis.AAC.1
MHFMIGWILPMGSSSLDVIIFSAAISACEKGGQWQRVVWMFSVTHSEELMTCTWGPGDVH